jgi:hypothetical protein
VALWHGTEETGEEDLKVGRVGSLLQQVRRTCLHWVRRECNTEDNDGKNEDGEAPLVQIGDVMWLPERIGMIKGQRGYEKDNDGEVR